MPVTADDLARCYACAKSMNVAAVPPFCQVKCPTCGKLNRVKTAFGPYRLLRRHAVGGMSSVFVGRDETLDREVALKILSETYSSDRTRISAFVEEARITASLSHPHVVRVLKTGRAFGRFFIAMELVRGGHLEHHIHKRARLPEAEVLGMAVQIGEGLKAAQAAGLIHRDIKPGNILLDAEGNVKIVDFGLALVTKGGKAQAAEVWATPYYVPPETIDGEPEDFRSDIYAFGATLYHALCGQPSCGENCMSTDLLREAKRRVIPLSQRAPFLSAEICQLVDRAMAYEPRDRFSTYDEMIALMEAALIRLKGTTAADMKAAEIVKRQRSSRKRKERFTAAAGFGLIGAAAVGFWWPGHGMQESGFRRLEPNLQRQVEAQSGPDVARLYRVARTALKNEEYARAATLFSDLQEDRSIPEPTRTWAGVEAIAAAFLAGESGEARAAAVRLLTHANVSDSGLPGIGEVVLPVVAGLGDFPAVFLQASEYPADGASQVMAALLAGLKNWEQGLLAEGARCFHVAVAVKPAAESRWIEFYQQLAQAYLADYALLSGPLFGEMPATAEACSARVVELERVRTALQTRGRATFNVHALQVDLERQAKVLESIGGFLDADGPDLAEVMETLSGLAASFEFLEAARYLRSVSAGRGSETDGSLLAVAEAAAVFLSDLENDLARTPVEADLALRSGEIIQHLASTSEGGLVAKMMQGAVRPLVWRDIAVDSLIELHRVMVKNSPSESERLRRHECAISFDWLAGNRARALAAAERLSQESPAFKRRWDEIARGLPRNPQGK